MAHGTSRSSTLTKRSVSFRSKSCITVLCWSLAGPTSTPLGLLNLTVRAHHSTVYLTHHIAEGGGFEPLRCYPPPAFDAGSTTSCHHLPERREEESNPNPLGGSQFLAEMPQPSRGPSPSDERRREGVDDSSRAANMAVRLARRCGTRNRFIERPVNDVGGASMMWAPESGRAAPNVRPGREIRQDLTTVARSAARLNRWHVRRAAEDVSLGADREFVGR
jgi:hypothetical protein